MKLFSVLVAVAEAGRFNCSTFAPPPMATEVSNLHPGHVKFVLAMGDSITAAFAARAKLQEDRDISWAIGEGNADQLTVPYILGQYNPTGAVHGYSTAAIIPKDITNLPHNDYHPLTDHLNVAESEGAVHRGSMDEQWGIIQQQRKKYADFDDDVGSWKVITVWMTANDVCGKCDAPLANTTYLNNWVSKTNELISNVSSTMKNVYINLVSTLDLSNIARLQRSNLKCLAEHKTIIQECGCIDKGNKTQLEMLDENTHTMNGELHKLASQWYTKLQQEGRKDMAVVSQSFQESIGSTLDLSFLNTLDCFHPSAKAHQLLAIGLWNSMLCIDDRKNRCGIHFSADMAVTCPTAKSVFYTGPDVIPGPPPMI
jgi:phospholipase B1